MVIYPLGGTFSYQPDGSKYKPGSWILSNLVDIVAKGGNFQVAIGPDRSGRFHPEAVKRLEYVGDWLATNGEAIYNTRPWTHWKEGADLRFTRSKDGKYVYAISLKWPGKTLELKSVRPREGSQVTMLGVKAPLPWRLDGGGTAVDLPTALQEPANRPCQQCYVFKIEGSR
jgi:alpha-L-fucosidase